MRKRLMFFAALVVAALSVSLAGGSALAANSSVVYNAVPSPLPPNVASVGFEATSTSQFGDHVHLAGTSRVLNAVTVTMSDWALYSDYSSDVRYSGNSSTWSHPITVNVYSNHLGTNGAPDTLLASNTQNVTIPWRPAADPTCSSNPTAWKAPNGQCYNGLAFNATIDMSSPKVTLPNDVIIGIAFNTADYGQAPIGAAGPYNSLNVGVPNGQTATVGTDDNADNVFWNTSYAPFYTDGGAAGSGIFRQDTNWTPNGTVALQLNASATCTQTGFFRDGINMTAAQIGGNVTGSLDAAGCNIGVYYGPGTTGTVSGANISGANYFGVVADGAAVNVTGSNVHDIGEVPLNGSQHGNAIYYTNAASGTISGNTVGQYQKNGITAVNGSSVMISGNTVTGEGPVNYIAQNGIEVGSGAKGTVQDNTVSGNAYTGPNGASSGGVLVFGGPIYGVPYTTGVQVVHNTLTNNDVGIYLYNADALGNPPKTQTKNGAVNNTITNNLDTPAGNSNTSGCSPTQGYQVGVSDFGTKDSIVNNKISGIGYTPATNVPVCTGTAPTWKAPIDTSGVQKVHLKNNK
jgi:hypothetical protein